MRRPVPVVSTAIVLLAAATMVALGMWQLRRMGEKEALLSAYESAITTKALVAWPKSPREYPAALYRRSRVDCRRVERIEPIAGRSAEGRPGWAQIAHCRLPDGAAAVVAIGWSNSPRMAVWSGGEVEGLIGYAGKGVRMVASPPKAGLNQLAAPDPKDIPNNHLAYAGQWFFFAATALVIYVLALRRRWRGA